MEETKRAGPGKTMRIAVFANFFKGYMSVSTIVAASIPIPIATWKLIPIYSQQRGYLTVYASLFCFLLLAFVFSIRHRLAVPMFSKGKMSSFIAALPFLFIVLTLACIMTYHAVLQQSIEQLRGLGTSIHDGRFIGQGGCYGNSLRRAAGCLLSGDIYFRGVGIRADGYSRISAGFAATG